jgi:hypothetical protein
MKAAAVPVAMLWMWTLAYGYREDRAPMHFLDNHSGHHCASVVSGTLSVLAGLRVCACAAGASGPLLAQARRRRRAKARRKPHATKRAVIGTASPRLNRSADNASDTADNASNTAAATATLKARFIPGSSKRSQGIERLQRGRFGRSQSPLFTTPHSIPTGPPLGAQKIGARA